MKIAIRWIRLLISYCLLVLFVFCAFNYRLSIYLAYQATGQLNILFNKQSFEEFSKSGPLNEKEKANLLLVEQIKKYSVDSLDYKPTDNFTEIYDQKHAPVLWVVTACEPYALKAYEWDLPVVGKVSYKGFFRRDLAEKEFYKLRASGYDAEIRMVSAWSTLGWFKDPLLSSMLGRSKGGLCNLLFHELFHATYYAPSSVDFNENIASFVAHNATIQFLKNDTSSLNEYLNNYRDNLIYNNFMLRQHAYLSKVYEKIKSSKDRSIAKIKEIRAIVDSLQYLPNANPKRTEARKKDIMESKNAYFVGFVQYDSKQDSLEKIFNKIYKGSLKNLVRYLKQKQINY